MAEYQNIFTRVQVVAPSYAGVALERGNKEREGPPWHSHLLGRLGDAQVGPIYLGWFGLASLICGFIALEIVGLNMLASVNWDPVQFVRQLPWLALEPPSGAQSVRRLGGRDSPRISPASQPEAPGNTTNARL